MFLCADFLELFWTTELDLGERAEILFLDPGDLSWRQLLVCLLSGLSVKDCHSRACRVCS